jgi:hypothetical protein
VSGTAFIVGGFDVAIVTDRSGKTGIAPGVPIDDFTVVAAAVAAPLVTDSDSVYAPACLSTISLLPALYSDADAVYAPAVVPGAISLLPALVSDADAFYAATLAAGAVSLLPGLLAQDDVIYAPTVAAGAAALLPGLVSDADVIFAASTAGAAGATLLPALVAADDVIYAATVLAGSLTLTPSRITDADTIYAPVVGQDRVLRPALFVDPESVYPAFSIAAAQLPKTQTLKPPPKVQDPDIIYAARLSLSPQVVVDADVIFATITQAEYPLRPSLVASDDAVFGPSLASLAQPGPVTDDDAIYGASITLFLAPQLVADADAIPAADVGWKVFAGVTNDVDVVYGIVVHTFNGLLPDIYEDEESIDTYPFYVHALTGGIPVPKPPGILTGSVNERRRLTGSVNQRPHLTGSVKRKGKVLTGSLYRK